MKNLMARILLMVLTATIFIPTSNAMYSPSQYSECPFIVRVEDCCMFKRVNDIIESRQSTPQEVLTAIIGRIEASIEKIFSDIQILQEELKITDKQLQKTIRNNPYAQKELIPFQMLIEQNQATISELNQKTTNFLIYISLLKKAIQTLSENELREILAKTPFSPVVNQDSRMLTLDGSNSLFNDQAKIIASALPQANQLPPAPIDLSCF